jgi:myo-inositol 2-dehydrogenase / D-chiro-inositol 1-dehydrogenase
MQKEYALPVSVKGEVTFSKGLWNTIETFDLTYTYDDGVVMNYVIDKPYVKFEGESGWVSAGYPDQLEASNPAWITFDRPSGNKDYSATLSDKEDFLRAVRSGKDSLEPLEVGHNVYFTTVMGLIAVKLGRELKWDANLGQFIDDNAANAMLNRPFREKWLDKDVVDWMNKFQTVSYRL